MRKTRHLALFVAAYIAGITIGDGASSSAVPLTFAATLFSLAAIAGLTRRLPRITFALISAAFFSFGLSRLPARSWSSGPLTDDPHNAECEGTIASPIQGTAGRSTFIVESVSCYRGRDPTPIDGNVRVTVASATLAVRTGDRVRLWGKLVEPPPALNEGETDRRRTLARTGVRFELWARSEDAIDVVGHSRGAFVFVSRAAEGLRNNLVAKLAGRPERADAALVAAILLGDRRALEPAATENYTVTGVLHIIAVSGLHLVFVMWVFAKIASVLARRSERVLLSLDATRFAWICAFPCALFYVLMTGAPSSAVRAIVMVGIAALAIFTRRFCSPTRALLLAVLVICLVDPAAPFDVSFVLSVASVMAIIALAPALKGRERLSTAAIPPAFPSRIKKLLLASARTTTAATLGSAPFTALFFQRIASAGLITNLILIPLGSLLLASALLWGLTEFALPPAADFVLTLPLALARAFNAVASWMTAPSEYVSLTFAPSLLQVVILVGALSLFALRSRRRGCLTASIFLFAVSVAVEVTHRATRAPTDAVRVTFLAVGQGDSTLIEFPNGRVMLVDGGGSLIGDDRVGPRMVVPFLRRKRISRVDWMVLSHPHVDHAGGLAAVVKAVEVGEIWATGQPWSGPGLTRLKAEVSRRAIPIRIPPPVPVCDATAPWLCIIHPIATPEASHYFEDLSVNSNSLVLRMSVGALRFLFTGDVEADVESELVATSIGLRAEILKVPHHGSRTSSTRRFLDAVRPTVAIASLGRDNPFRFPHRAVVERYRSMGIILLRTDTDGQITVTISTGGAKTTTFSTRRTFDLPQQIRPPADNLLAGGETG